MAQGNRSRWNASVCVGFVALALLACKKDQLQGLTLAREESGAKEAVIGPDGGTLSVTTGDGTVLSLSVPKLALATDTKIRAVPARLAGSKVKGWAVAFEPTGLEFMVDARLTITPPTAVPEKQQLLFGMSDDQREIFATFVDLRTPAPTPTAIVKHFSAYGLAEANDAQRDMMLRRQVADKARAINSRIGAAMQAEVRARKAGEGPTDWIGALNEAAKDYEEEVVKPQLAAAGTSCAALGRALRAIVDNERMRELLNVQVPSTLDRNAIDEAKLVRDSPCEKEAVAACKRSRDPRELIVFWLGLERMRALRNLPRVTPVGPDLFKEAAKVCRPGYAAKSKGSGPKIAGNIDDLTKPFTLFATFPGGTATLSYTPSSDKSGTYTVSGGGSGATMNAKGSYTVSENDDGTLTLEQQDSGCVDVSGKCGGMKHTLVLTPR